MRNKKKKANIEESVEELVRLVENELKDLRFRDILANQQPLWERAKPKRWDELTEEEQETLAKEQSEAEQEFIRGKKFLIIKQFLQSIIKAKGDDPNSELSIKAEELLEFVVKYESNSSSVSNYEWNRFESIFLPKFEALLKTEQKRQQELKQAEEDYQQRGKFGFLGKRNE